METGARTTAEVQIKDPTDLPYALHVLSELSSDHRSTISVRITGDWCNSRDIIEWLVYGHSLLPTALCNCRLILDGIEQLCLDTGGCGHCWIVATSSSELLYSAVAVTSLLSAMTAYRT